MAVLAQLRGRSTADGRLLSARTGATADSLVRVRHEFRADGGTAVGRDGRAPGQRDRNGVDLGRGRVALGAGLSLGPERGGALRRVRRVFGVDGGRGWRQMGQAGLGAGVDGTARAGLSLGPGRGGALRRVRRGFGVDGGTAVGGPDGCAGCGVGTVGVLRRSWRAVRGADGGVGPRRGV